MRITREQFEALYEGFVVGTRLNGDRSLLRNGKVEASIMEKFNEIGIDAPCGKILPTGDAMKVLPLDALWTEINFSNDELTLIIANFERAPWSVVKMPEIMKFYEYLKGQNKKWPAGV